MCPQQGFLVQLPATVTAMSVTGCSAQPTARPGDAGGNVFVVVESAGTCHVDVTLADGSHRAGDSVVAYVDRTCCAGYAGPAVDLSH